MTTETVNDHAVWQSRSTGWLCLVERLRELDEKGYQPLTGAIGNEAAAEIELLRQDAARYNWLVGKVFSRGETCLALYEEFGGAPFKGDTIRMFMDRYIDAAIMHNGEIKAGA